MRALLNKLLGRSGAEVPLDHLPIEGEMPEFEGIVNWYNGNSLKREDLLGKVVLIDFWTSSCINCIRTLPHVNAWHERYADEGLVIIGIHTPEFDFEKKKETVTDAIKKHDIKYPIAMDNDYVMWRAYKNRYWPAHYFVDKKGQVRYHHFGEGGYEHSEEVIRALLAEDSEAEAGPRTELDDTSVEIEKVGTPETYFGYDRAEYLGSPETMVMNAVSHYSIPKTPALNVFYLEGDWEIQATYAIPHSNDAKLLMRYKASKVTMVADTDDESYEIQVSLDSEAISKDFAGQDVTEGILTARTGRLYSIVDTGNKYDEHLLELTFKDPGIKVYSFTFG